MSNRTCHPPQRKTPARTRRIRAMELVESLESRICLSAVPTAATGASEMYRIAAWSNGDAGSQYGATYSNPQFTQAQTFFNLFRNRFQPYVNPNPNPNPDPTPDPTPTPNPTPTPGAAATITQVAEGSLTRLVVTGPAGGDKISISESGDTFTITCNGNIQSETGNFAELAVYATGGGDTITVQSSVNISCLIYGESGNNTITALGSAQSYIVTIGGGGKDTLTGNGANTSYWVTPTDTVHASSAENAGGDVHVVSGFYQPFSSSPSNPKYIPLTLGGQTLPEPTDSGTTVNVTASLWGTGPVMTDINQGQVGDCYFLASIQSLAFAQPAKLEEMAVDLGDGTYAVQFKRGGTTSYVRVDANFPDAPWGGLYYAHPQSGGAIWAEVMEKAYAFFRSGAGTYASLNSGWTGSVFGDLGVSTNTFNTGGSGLFNQLTTAVNAGKAVAAITVSTMPSGIPIIGSHAYSVVATSVVSGVQFVTVRNPWGFDGAGSDSDTSDGLVTITMAQFNQAFTAGSIQV